MNERKRSSNKQRLLGIVVIVLWFAFTFLGPIYYLNRRNVPMDKEIDATNVNGILTLSSIIIAIELLYAKRNYSLLFLSVFTALIEAQLILLAITGMLYFTETVVGTGHLTVDTLFCAITSLFFNLSTLFTELLAPFFWNVEMKGVEHE